MKNFLYILSAGFLVFFIYACTDDDPTGPGSSDFDRQSMLINWADNIIIPAFTAFSGDTDQLKSAAEDFTADPTQLNLDALRNAWETAYLSFQHVSMFEMGKAMELRYRDNLNTYPVCTASFNEGRSSGDKCTPEIQVNIEQGNSNFELPEQIDVQGFPALDYLLYGLADNDAGIVAFYTSDPNAEGYKTYLTDLATRIDGLTNNILNHWENTYRDEFVNNSGSGANASVDMMVNDYIFYYEKALRAGKVGIPAGVFSGTPLSTHVEAFYRKDLSKALLLEAINAARNFFNGRHFNSTTTGESLKSYLDFLNTMKQGTDLGTLINNRFESARTEAQALNNNFSEQVETDHSKLLLAYDELQMNVVNMKVDMLQALNITVDYVDADGD